MHPLFLVSNIILIFSFKNESQLYEIEILTATLARNFVNSGRPCVQPSQWVEHSLGSERPLKFGDCGKITLAITKIPIVSFYKLEQDELKDRRDYVNVATNYFWQWRRPLSAPFLFRTTVKPARLQWGAIGSGLTKNWWQRRFIIASQWW